jgi:hypothetical protein
MEEWVVQGATTKKRCLAIWSLRMKDRCIRVSNPRALNAGGRGPETVRTCSRITPATLRLGLSVGRKWWRWRQILIAAREGGDDICTEDSLRVGVGIMIAHDAG